MMFVKRLYLTACIPALITGCAGFGGQTPAPVYQGAGSRVYQENLPNPVPAPASPEAKGAETAIETKPLETAPSITTMEIQPEPLLPAGTEQGLLTPEQEQELAALEKGQALPSAAPEDAQSDAAAEPMPPQAAETPPAAPVNPEAGAADMPKAEPPVAITPPAPPAFEPLQTFAPLSPVVGALVVAANKSSSQGNIDSATTTIERAIRIEPRNATLFYKLALLRLKQSKPRMAEDLAKKSALLASGDNQLKKHSWLLIAKAREMQNNAEGAKEAREKADKF